MSLTLRCTHCDYTTVDLLENRSAYTVQKCECPECGHSDWTYDHPEDSPVPDREESLS